MPYIGNPIYQSAFVTDQFSGDGTTTAFTMSVAPAGTTNVLVVVSGVVQDPTTYGVVGTTLNFSAAPPSGTGNISCRYLGIPVTGVTTTAYRTVTEFTATASQTTFTPPSYNVGFINVYLNGVLLGSADYTATNGTTVVLTTGASAGNLVTVESFQISSVANAIQNTAGAVSSSNIATGAVTPAKLSTGGPYWDTSSNVGIGTTSPSTYGQLAVYKSSGDVEVASVTASANYATYRIQNNAQRYSMQIRTDQSNAWVVRDETAGANRMLIDTSGRVTMPYQPSFKVGRSGAVAVAATGTIIFNTASVVGGHNIGSHYNTSTGVFTAPIAGQYLFSWMMLAEGVSSGTMFEFVLTINGNIASFSRRMYASTGTTMNGGYYCDRCSGMILQLAANDAVQVKDSWGTAFTLHGNANFTYFCGALLS